MVKNKIIIVSAICLLLGSDVIAQVNRYMIFFKDKENNGFTIDKPEEFLTERAISRRERYTINITEQDLPIAVNYINSVRETGADVFFKTRWFNGILVQMEASLENTIRELSFVDSIQMVAPGANLMRVDTTLVFRDNTSAGRMYNISNALQNNMLGVDKMHEDGYTGEGVMIGIFDAGYAGVEKSIYFDHLFEEQKIVAVKDFVRNSGNVFQYDDHGTGVLSTISGYYDTEYEGIAYDASVILCITEDPNPENIIEEYNWLFAAEFADSLGVDIINTSLGYNTFDNPDDNYTFQDLDGNTTVITRATDIAASKGILCIVSVGNEGNNSWQKLVAPADADSVLSVGAVDQGINHVSFSSTGPTADGRIKPEVVALGQSTKIIRYDGELSSGSGTSYASPLIAGLAAGLWQAFPELNNMEIINLIKRGSSQYYNPDTLLGYGLPDYHRIRSLITALDDEAGKERIRVYPNPVDHNKLFVELTETPSSVKIFIRIHDTNGRNLYTWVPAGMRSENKYELDLSAFSSGIYILYVSNGKWTENVKILIP